MQYHLYRITGIAMLACLVTACSGLDFFSNDRKENLKPASLVDFDEELQLRRLWSTNVGNGQGKVYNRLRPAISQDVIYVVSNDGHFEALNRREGDRLWRKRMKDIQVTGGIGYGNGKLFVGLADSRILALDASDGEVLWEVQASSEVLSVPQYSSGSVVVQTIDGKLIAYDANTGDRRWIYESTVPALSLRGTSSPLILGNYVISGFGNGSVVSVALDNGTLRWEQRIAVPTGRSEIERLVDVDGEILVMDGNMLIVPSYQGYLTALDANTGQVRWRVEESSVHGASSGFGNVYLANEKGVVTAYRLNQETPVWQNEALVRRNLSAPLAFNNYVAVGDLEGYIHFMAQSDGRFVARIRSDKTGMRSVMLSRSNILYIYGNKGSLAAYSIR